MFTGHQYFFIQYLRNASGINFFVWNHIFKKTTSDRLCRSLHEKYLFTR